MRLFRLPEAARSLGVSFPTLKQWIYRGKIRSVKTAGGHHRIPQIEIDRLSFQQTSASRRRAGRAAARPRPQRKSKNESVTGLENFISGRNQLVGRVTQVRTVGLLTKVCLDVGGQTVTAIITRDAARQLDLKAGDTAAALVKATEVMIIRPLG